MKRHYFDWAATAEPAMARAGEEGGFANASALHSEGRQAKEALEAARTRCAAVLGVKTETLYFTGGGTDANAIVLHSLLLHALSLKSYNSEILYSDVEHPSVQENCLLFNKLSLPTGAIGVEKDGRLSCETFSHALQKHPKARFAAIMGVNNETGAVMELDELIKLAREREKTTKLPIHIHADMVQAIGKIPFSLNELDLDSASISSHKLGGAFGMGLLYLKKPLNPLLRGGKQERGIKAGTENINGAVNLAYVLEKYAKNETVEIEYNKAIDRFSYLMEKLQKFDRYYPIPTDRSIKDRRFSPWILQAAFKGIPGEVMLRALDKEGIAISTGSACSSSSKKRKVLSAMGLSDTQQLEGIRISQGWTTDKEAMDALLNAIEKILSLI